MLTLNVLPNYEKCLSDGCATSFFIDFNNLLLISFKNIFRFHTAFLAAELRMFLIL